MNYLNKYLYELYSLVGKEQNRIPWLLFLFILLSIMDIIGLGLIVPYMLLITSPEHVSSAYINNIFLFVGLEVLHENIVFIVGSMLVFIFLLKTIFGIYIENRIIAFSERLKFNLRDELIISYYNLDYLSLISMNSSHYINMVKESANAYGEAMHAVLKITSNLIIAIVILSLLILQEPLMVMLLFVLFIAVIIAYNNIFSHRIKNYGRLNQIYTQKLFQATNEVVNGYKEIKIFGREEYFHNQVMDNAENIMNMFTKYQTLIRAPRFIIEMSIIIFIVFISLTSIHYGYDRDILASMLALFGVSAIRLVPIFSYFSTGYNQLRYYRDYVSSAYKVIDYGKEHNSTKKKKRTYNKGLFNEIALDKIYFNYNNKVSVLSEVTLNVKSGEAIGIMGDSGSGKTTLLNVLLGLITPQKGQVTFNGNPIKENVHLWHKHLAYLPQETLIIDDTLRQNIAFGVDSDKIDDDLILSSIRKSSLSQVVGQLPEGIETVLGENGIKLSGGQRQRVALARAFYNNRDVIIMDESTSALDAEMETEIIKEIQLLKGKVTLIIVSHRISTIKYCDRIYKLNNGNITCDIK